MHTECSEINYTDDASSFNTQTNDLRDGVDSEDIMNYENSCSESLPDEAPAPKDEEQKGRPSLAVRLLYYFLVFDVSYRSMEYLLTILRDEGLDVPSSVHNLKKPMHEKKASVILRSLKCGGKMAYASIKDNLMFCIQNNMLSFSNVYNCLKININVDGLPLFKSSPVTLWPILFSLHSGSFTKPLPIGIYVGFGKPDFCGFVQQLCDELREFKNYVSVSHNIFIKITDVVFICDSPARAFLQNVKSHSGYHACSYCRIVGVHNGRSVIFPYTNERIAERENDMYMTGEESNQISLSPLANIVSLKESFPFEYLHLVCLGITKRLVQSYLSNRHGLLPCHLTSAMLSKLDEKTACYKNVLPREFQRKVRSLKNHVYFKATEYRTLLLYTGPIFFRNILPLPYYHHFLLLHFSMYVFASPHHSNLYEHAKSCIERFLFDLGELFNSSAYTYNAHCLRHLYDFVKLFGPLDNFSSFPFENYLYTLKKRIKSGSFVLTQCMNSLQSMRNLFVSVKKHELYFSSAEPNNCAVVIHNGKSMYVLIEHVHEENSELLVSGRVYKFLSEFYTIPYNSSTLGIGNFTLTLNRIHKMKPVNKCIVFPNHSANVIIPFAVPSCH